MKFLGVFSIALFLLLSPILPLTAQNGSSMSLETAKVVSKGLQKTISLPGDLTPYQAVNIHAKVTGFLESIEVDRGSWVKQGDALALLTAPELKAQQLEAEAKVQRSASQRAEAEAKLAGLQSTLAAGQANVAASQSTYDRLKAASQTPGVIAGNDLDVAAKSLEAQRMNLEAQKSSIDAQRSSIETLKTERAAAEAAASVIKEMEQYLRVAAPFDGVITERNVHPGSLVGPSGIPMLKLEQVSRLRLTVPVPETYVGVISKGKTVTFKVNAFPNETFQAVIARPAYSLDMKTRSMMVELDVNNTRLRLAPGMFADVQWPVSRQGNSLFVPKSAVVRTTERQFVVRVRGGLAEWVDVQRGEINGDDIEVFGDLREGDVIVRRGNDEIRPGTRIVATVPKP